MGTEGVKRFRLQFDMHCRCKGCIDKIEKAMASIGSYSGIKTSVADIATGTVTVVGKVNPTEVCSWLKEKTKKNVEVAYPDPPVEKQKQKMILVRGSSSKPGHTTPSAPPLQDTTRKNVKIDPPIEKHKQKMTLVRGSSSYHGSLELIENQIRELKKARDELKIKNLEDELIAVKRELKIKNLENELIAVKRELKQSKR